MCIILYHSLEIALTNVKLSAFLYLEIASTTVKLSVLRAIAVHPSAPLAAQGDIELNHINLTFSRLMSPHDCSCVLKASCTPLFTIVIKKSFVKLKATSWC